VSSIFRWPPPIFPFRLPCSASGTGFLTLLCCGVRLNVAFGGATLGYSPGLHLRRTDRIDPPSPHFSESRSCSKARPVSAVDCAVAPPLLFRVRKNSLCSEGDLPRSVRIPLPTTHPSDIRPLIAYPKFSPYPFSSGPKFFPRVA